MLNNLSGLSDGQLISLYREGDDRAFDVLFDRHLAFAVNLARRWFRSEDDVQDICHDSFVRLSRNLHTFDDSRPVRPLLGKIVWNQMKTRYRKMQLDINSRALELSNDVQSSPDVYDLPGCGDEELARALSQLSDPYRALLELRYIDGLPFKDIGIALGQSYVLVRVNHSRAKTALREKLSHVD